MGVEGVASVKEKLKTVSKDLEDFVDASHDIPRDSHELAKIEITDGEEDGSVDFGTYDAEDRHSHL